jgi:glycosyltransferase involved in cell wall biosynthesis
MMQHLTSAGAMTKIFADNLHTPLVTIAIPTYERLNYLKEAVASALSQSYENIEVLIGDDGSNGLLCAWCKEQVREHPQIRYQRNSRNLGLAANWNALADAARGEFIVIIGDDDRLLPEFVSKAIGAILPDGAVAFSNHFIIDHEGTPLNEQSQLFSKEYGRDDLRSGRLMDAEMCAWRHAIPISASLIRTAAVRQFRFKEDLNNPEVEFFIRLARSGGKFSFLADYLAEYRIHSQSATASLGLTSEHLVKYLIGIPVRPEIETLKIQYLEKEIVNAVNQSLLAGESANARKLLASEYYPNAERRRLRGVVQSVCAYLPR